MPPCAIVSKSMNMIGWFEQKMSDEAKLAADRKCWSGWLDKYISRLEGELSGDVQTLNTQRVQIMLENNPRCVLDFNLSSTHV